MLEASVTLGSLQKLSEVSFVCILKNFQNLHQIDLSHVFIPLVTIIIPWDHMLKKHEGIKKQDSKDFLFKWILIEGVIVYVSIDTTLVTTMTNTNCLAFPLHIWSYFI